MPDSPDRRAGDTRPLPRFNRQRPMEDGSPETDPVASQDAKDSAGGGTGVQEQASRAVEVDETGAVAGPAQASEREASRHEHDTQPIAVVPPPPYPRSVPDQDRIPTPPPLRTRAEPGQAEVQVSGTHWSLKTLVVLSLAIALISLALNGLLIYRLMAVQQKATDAVDRAIATLDKLGKEGFHYEYHFNRTIPFSGDIPFKQDLVFPFEGTIPIDTTINVPIDAGLIKTTIPVRVNTSVYVNTEVPISIDETFHVSTTIPVDMTIPIDIKPDDPVIQELIDEIRDWLIELTKLF